MDNETRLLAALASSGAPRRDPAFTMAVIRAAEAARYRTETIRSMLKAAGIAAAGASLILPVLGWAAANSAGLQNGVLGAASLFVLVAGARLLSARATAILRH